jgi:alanine racemase
VTEPPLDALGAASAAPGTIVSVSADALRANARHARSAPVDTDPRAADAWGHGAGWVADVLARAGIDADAAAALSGDDLYGLPEGAPDSRPVMRLEGRVLSTKELRTGEGVSYGYLFRAAEDTRIALVSGGYAQGVVRALGGRADVVIGGRRCPIVGRVAMDVCVVDIRDLDVHRGAAAVYFGDPGRGEPSLREWTAATAYRGAELVTAVGLRGRRVPA